MLTAASEAVPPLVVDLDGTLTPTDTLVEAVVALVKRQPLLLPSLLWWLLSGRAAFKCRVAAHVRLSARTLPWRADFLAWLREQRAAGRRLVLATAAHEDIAREVAHELGIFDAVLATGPTLNLKGRAKLAAIRKQVGDRFVYAGDSRADLPIWAAAEAAVLVGATEGVATQVRQRMTVEREFPAEGRGWGLWLRAMRVHQWVKNLLLLVPLLTSFSFGDLHKVGTVIAAFLAFSLAASGTYLLNDLWDLEGDRQHARKRQRPFASGALPVSAGVVASAGLMAVAMLVAANAGLRFTAMLLGYIVLTTAYSLVFKRYVLMDVIVLALLYTYRVLAGAVAIAVSVTPWLLAFSVFTFLSLALVKRCAELASLAETGKTATRGRDYRTSDLVVLWPLGVGASLCSVVVFGLYIGTPEARNIYGDTSLLWLVGVGLIYWTSRMWIKTSRGEMHDDPVVFALKDRGSRVAVLTMAALPIIAHVMR